MREKRREEFDVHLIPFSLIQNRSDSDSMSSWYSAGYG